MFAVGHMAVAYLLGKASSKALNTKLNIPILLVLSILPDIDIIYDLLTGAEIHRGPTHSIIVALIVFVPLFVYYGRQVIPYFLALISHFLIADFIIGGQLQLFWPLSSAEFGLYELGSVYIQIFDPFNIMLEIGLFAVATTILYRTSDWKVFFRPNKLSLVLVIPIATVLLPSTIGYPFTNSLLFTAPILALAHIFYLVLFSVAVYKTLAKMYKEQFGGGKNDLAFISG